MNIILLLASLVFIGLMIVVAWFINNKLGEQIKFLLDVLFYTRVSVVGIVLGMLILLIDQGRDLAIGLTDSYSRAFWFLLAVSLWAMQSWYCARKILDRIYEQSELTGKWQHFVVSAVPRILGSMAFLFAIISLWQAADSTVGYVYITITIAMTVVFCVLVIYRRDIQRHAGRIIAINFEKTLFHIMHGLAVVTIVVFSCWAFISPVHMGFTLGAGTIAFIVMASVIPVGTVMVYYTVKQQFPVVLSLLLIAMIFSRFNDNHAIRSHALEAKRIPPDTAFNQWQQHNPDQEKQLVLVATAGGGIRAAYWTATILGAVQDEYPDFRNKLFAISGVSGGTVGAAVFTTLLAQDPTLCAESKNCYAEKGQTVLSKDFLGPTVASMLYPDFIQRLLPLAGLPDRARALETSWETSWNDTLPQNENAFGAAFTQQWSNQNKNWLPLLLSNSTHEETGARIITSAMRIDREIFPDTNDFFDIVPCDIPVSTAAHNSARFTYISPAGRISSDRCQFEAKLPSLNNTHLVDGGYFENYGAASAHDLLRWLSKKAAQEHIQLKPIVIQISNDTQIPEKILSSDYQPTAVVARAVNETLAPIKTMFRTRGARGVMELINLYRWTEDYPENNHACFFHFRFYKTRGLEPALGWVLSRKSQQWIRDHLDNQNHEVYISLIEALRSGQCS
ncbi:MAG: hypothetical protein JXA04_06530 [Gammaproteobacteria bacterium]|nr:hypothetical protein [Gammaproteobacteria bacterium]